MITFPIVAGEFGLNTVIVDTGEGVSVILVTPFTPTTLFVVISMTLYMPGARTHELYSGGVTSISRDDPHSGVILNLYESVDFGTGLFSRTIFAGIGSGILRNRTRIVPFSVVTDMIGVTTVAETETHSDASCFFVSVITFPICTGSAIFFRVSSFRRYAVGRIGR